VSRLVRREGEGKAWGFAGFGRGGRGWDVLLSQGSFRAGRRSPRSSAGAHLVWPA
jgi:hypothetical protein